MENKDQVQLLVVTNRPMVKSFFEYDKSPDYKLFNINFLPMDRTKLDLYIKENKLQIAAIDIIPDPEEAIGFCQSLYSINQHLAIVGLVCCNQHIAPLHLHQFLGAGMTSIASLVFTQQVLLSTLKRIAYGHVVIQVEFGKDCSPFLSDVAGNSDSKSATNDFFFSEDNICLLEHVAQGFSDKDIASILHSSPFMIHHNIQRLCKYMGAKNRTELAAKAASWGFYHL